MIEKVNPSHPDKVADRIAGAIVDLAYAAEENPKIAIEVLIGHSVCHAIIETTANLDKTDICRAIHPALAYKSAVLLHPVFIVSTQHRPKAGLPDPPSRGPDHKGSPQRPILLAHNSIFFIINIQLRKGNDYPGKLKHVIQYIHQSILLPQL